MDNVELKMYIEDKVIKAYFNEGLMGTEDITVAFIVNYKDYCAFCNFELDYGFNFEIEKVNDDKYIIYVSFSEIPDTHLDDLLNKRFLTYDELDELNDVYEVEDNGLSGEYPGSHLWTVYTLCGEYEVYTD